ncbi:hypothetical protein ACIRRA_42175 [Nocardia sp. NPDC101769]
MNPYVVIQNLLNHLDLGSAGSSSPVALAQLSAIANHVRTQPL